MRVLRFWLGCCFLLLGQWVSAALPPLVIDESGYQQVGGHFMVLPDYGALFKLAELIERPELFSPAPSGAPGYGFHAGTVWVRFELQNTGTAPVYRWLEVDWPFKERVDLHLVDAQGAIHVYRNGAAVPLEKRPVESRNILFPVQLAAGESQTAYLAFSGNAATSVKLALWRPEANLDAARRYAALKYLALGSIFLVMVFSVLAWQASGRAIFLLGGLGDFLLIPIMLSLDGFAFDFLSAGPELYQTRLVNALAGTFFICHIIFARAYLGIANFAPRLDQAMRAMAIILLIFTVAAALTLSPRLAAYPSLLVFLILSGVSLYAARHGGRDARIYLLSWGMLWLSATFRSLQLVGWLPRVPALHDLYMIGVIGSALTLTYALYLNVRSAREAVLSSQRELLRRQESENARLEAAVEEKTRDLQRAKAQAEEASEAKSAFLSMMSHELRAPLHTILGYTHLLSPRGATVETSGNIAAKLGIIENSGRQLLRLINEVLDYSRGDVEPIKLEVRPVQLSRLIAQVVDANRPFAARQGNEITATIDRSVPTWVEVDEQRLMQILQNLVGNACKFTEDGLIELEVSLVRSASMPRGWQRLHFAVTDNGMGILPEHHERIFMPFQRLPDSQRIPGVGLGLPIVKQLLAAMGGQVSLKSEQGKGSCFSFNLDLQVATDDNGAPEPVGRIVGYHGPQRTLLVIDDLPENRRYLRLLCQQWGFRVQEATDGLDGLRVLSEAASPIDAILVDQFMPEMDGWRFLREVRESAQWRNLPVILISAAEASRPQDFPETYFFDRILLKPLDTPLLANVLQETLGIQWHEEVVPVGAPLLSASFSCLPEAERAALRSMVELGQIIAIRHWAKAMGERYPECESSVTEILGLCEMVDLPALQRLAEAP
jgi:signal transduction histidine kinase/CheY-like chemotaxis protein